MHIVDDGAVHARLSVGEQREQRQRLLARRGGHRRVDELAAQRRIRGTRVIFGARGRRDCAGMRRLQRNGRRSHRVAA